MPNPDETELETLRREGAALLLDWARLLAPHYGPSGSLDLDLRDWPGAQGPSYYNQFGSHALLMLATGEVPGADEGERERYRELALRNIGYVLAITADDFHTPHFSRGRDWGRHIGEWVNYYLLCALEIMERHPVGSEELRQRLRAAVTGAVGALHVRFVEKFRTAPTEFPGNHDVWHGLLFSRAGRTLGRPEWSEFARDFMHRCVLPFQSADGYWPEGHGIVVGYSLVTAQAISLYAELADDVAARASIHRFVGFFDHLGFPDGSSSVALDVRMRYAAAPFMFVPPGMLALPQCRHQLVSRLATARAHLRQHGVRDNLGQAFAFYGSFAEHLFGAQPPVNAAPIPQPKDLPAAVLVESAWRAVVSWQLVPEHPSRFVLDAQNFIELWHARAGYLAGTGGSKYMPRFSTLRRTNGGRAYLPTAARCVRASANEVEVVYRFDEDEIVVTITLDGETCRVTAALVRDTGDRAYEFALILALHPGEVLRSEHGEDHLDPTVLIQHHGGPRPQRGFVWRDLDWQLPAGAQLDYPLVPHNSYTQDGLPAPKDYVGRLSFALTVAPKTITIRPA